MALAQSNATSNCLATSGLLNHLCLLRVRFFMVQLMFNIAVMFNALLVYPVVHRVYCTDPRV